MNRSWCLTLYGNGQMKNSIEHLVKRFGLVGRGYLGCKSRARNDISV